MENINPNNIKVGDVIEVQQAWEDESGGLHDEFATVTALDEETGELTLDWPTPALNDFLRNASDFLAKDYTPEKN